MEWGMFRRTPRPAAQAGLPVNRHATWHTWSDPFRLFLRDAAAELSRLANPPLVTLSGLREYNRTFSRSLSDWRNAEIGRRFTLFARSLYATRPRHKLMLLDGLLGADLDAAKLHVLFALMRGTLVDLTGDEREAMYTPLGQVGDRQRGFPLHADLYLARILFNVFDKVPSDNSGASLFLPVSALEDLIPHVKRLPPATGKRILAMFNRKPATDRFAALYDLLHGNHGWVEDLERAMERHQFRIKLHAGQGYILDDRAWLHGREVPTGGVAIDRVHRLVFGRNDDTIAPLLPLVIGAKPEPALASS